MRFGLEKDEPAPLVGGGSLLVPMRISAAALPASMTTRACMVDLVGRGPLLGQADPASGAMDPKLRVLVSTFWPTHLFFISLYSHGCCRLTTHAAPEEP